MVKRDVDNGEPKENKIVEQELSEVELARVAAGSGLGSETEVIEY